MSRRTVTWMLAGAAVSALLAPLLARRRRGACDHEADHEAVITSSMLTRPGAAPTPHGPHISAVAPQPSSPLEDLAREWEQATPPSDS